MILRKRRKPDYHEIDRLEHELGLDDSTARQQWLETRKSREWKENGGVVELAPVARLHRELDQRRTADSLELLPGSIWPVASSGHVAYQNVCVSGYSQNYRQVFSQRCLLNSGYSRVVLPKGVRREA